MRKPEFDVFDASFLLAIALDYEDWDKVKLVFKRMNEYKKELQVYESSKRKRK